VVGTDDGLEHLRFDCFEANPHYHYIRNAEQRNIIVRIDEIALGDPASWAIECLRTRMPEMLEHAGATGLANAVRSHPQPVADGIDQVARLLGQLPAQRSGQ
jgi:hypothetical protein